MKILVALIVGFVLAFAAFWYLADRRPDATVVDSPGTEERRNPEPLFDTDAIREELSRTGQVIREKATEAGKAIGEATEDARTTGSIKAELVKDPTVSALAIDVDTTDGLVTLSGKVDSHDQIARALEIALATEGVRKVVSSLQVAEPAR
jgi:hypothetical protein